MTKLSKEDIQAIAQELNTLQKQEQINQKQEQSASARVCSGSKYENNQQPKKANNNNSKNSGEMPKNLGSVVLILIWLIVFGVLLFKVWAYI